MFSTPPPRPYTAVSRQVNCLHIGIVASFESIPTTLRGTSQHTGLTDRLCPRMSSKDRGLLVVGKPPPVNPCKTNVV